MTITAKSGVAYTKGELPPRRAWGLRSQPQGVFDVFLDASSGYAFLNQRLIFSLISPPRL